MQIALSDWPARLCREIATIDATTVSQQLSGKLTFERGHDDLDAFSAAIFMVDQAYFALQLYDNIPTGDFTLLVMNDLVDDLLSFQTFLKWSGVPMGAVKWRLPPDTD